ncbi:hypothetical protein [Gallaecimonas xiamenensis]|uniref:Lipoprotein n=1 Tax=Gallaecimonas xiamenensis 3-C-1 TaxID=745411 RepID=K2JY42_9GAMM|nr:hypothetical protein [Gallaecimonas xiamenensis]EKE75204.1 hypothetical protein B3C1_08006 [Gallaecimonas xiamenensis 3-C-1]
MKKNLVIIAAALLAGCAAAPHNYQPVKQPFSFPAVGSVETVQVGQAMLKQGVAAKSEAIHLDNEQVAGRYTLLAGSYPKIGEDSQYNYYSAMTVDGRYITFGMFDLAAPTASFRIDKQTGKVCIYRPEDTVPCADVTYTKDVVNAPNAGGSEQALIYEGKANNQLKVAYRETGSKAGNVNGNAIYDLSDSKIIGYKGAEIEVIEATNTSIKYKLIKHF